MHFTTLGYSRPDGQTSDHWTKGGVAKLQWEPEFYQYVRDAFAPVGMMIDFWNNTVCLPEPGSRAGGVDQRSLPVVERAGDIARVKRGDRVLIEQNRMRASRR